MSNQPKDGVTLRGKVWTVENIVWNGAEPDVGIMSSYVDTYDLVDEGGNVWDWNTEVMTPEEEKAVDAVISNMVQEYDDYE